MASAAANHVRSSIGPQGQTLHLGSFSRIDIADFDSKVLTVSYHIALPFSLMAGSRVDILPLRLLKRPG